MVGMMLRSEVLCAPILAKCSVRSARKCPSLSSASSVSTTLSRACSSDIRPSVRSEIHFTGRPVSSAANSDRQYSGPAPPFMPNPPPMLSQITRSLVCGTLRICPAMMERGPCTD